MYDPLLNPTGEVICPTCTGRTKRKFGYEFSPKQHLLAVALCLCVWYVSHSTSFTIKSLKYETLIVWPPSFGFLIVSMAGKISNIRVTFVEGGCNQREGQRPYNKTYLFDLTMTHFGFRIQMKILINLFQNQYIYF